MEQLHQQQLEILRRLSVIQSQMENMRHMFDALIARDERRAVNGDQHAGA